MKIFIDTNIFLDFYRSGADKIEILQSLKEHKTHIVFPEQVYNEFKRNRIVLLTNYLDNLNKSAIFPAIQSIPLIRNCKEFQEFNDIRNLFKEKKNNLINLIEDMISDPTKDIILTEVETLYNSPEIKIINNSEDIINNARKRQILGNPPKAYKKTDALSAGDEIIWEALLANVNDDIVIVSRDNTYKYCSDFLCAEFVKVTGKELKRITSTIKDALEIIGEPASESIAKLEDDQLKEVIINAKRTLEFPIVIDNKFLGYAPLHMENSSGENIRFCYNCQCHVKFSGVRCTNCGAFDED